MSAPLGDSDDEITEWVAFMEREAARGTMELSFSTERCLTFARAWRRRTKKLACAVRALTAIRDDEHGRFAGNPMRWPRERACAALAELEVTT